MQNSRIISWQTASRWIDGYIDNNVLELLDIMERVGYVPFDMGGGFVSFRRDYGNVTTWVAPMFHLPSQCDVALGDDMPDDDDPRWQPLAPFLLAR